jgi:putative FmdB family regulatory protein
MPLYEYTCRQCEHAFEALVFGNDEVECPECHGRQLEKKWSVPARPTAGPAPLPTACNSDGPPCGPACRRFPG